MVGYDVPDFAVDQGAGRPADPDGIGLDACRGTDPFIMKADGKGWLFAPTGLVDGPLPTHYEPVESPVAEPALPEAAEQPGAASTGRATTTSWRSSATRASRTSSPPIA